MTPINGPHQERDRYKTALSEAVIDVRRAAEHRTRRVSVTRGHRAERGHGVPTLATLAELATANGSSLFGILERAVNPGVEVGVPPGGSHGGVITAAVIAWEQAGPRQRDDGGSRYRHTVGNMLIMMRKHAQRNGTIDAVMARANLSFSQIRRYERGFDKPSWHRLLDLCHAYQIGPLAFLVAAADQSLGVTAEILVACGRDMIPQSAEPAGRVYVPGADIVIAGLDAWAGPDRRGRRFPRGSSRRRDGSATHPHGPVGSRAVDRVDASSRVGDSAERRQRRRVARFRYESALAALLLHLREHRNLSRKDVTRLISCAQGALWHCETRGVAPLAMVHDCCAQYRVGLMPLLVHLITPDSTRIPARIGGMQEKHITKMVLQWACGASRTPSLKTQRDAYRGRVAALVTTWRENYVSDQHMALITDVLVRTLHMLMVNGKNIRPALLDTLARAHGSTLLAVLAHLADPASAAPEREYTCPDADRITAALIAVGGDVPEDYQPPPLPLLTATDPHSTPPATDNTRPHTPGHTMTASSTATLLSTPRLFSLIPGARFCADTVAALLDTSVITARTAIVASLAAGTLTPADRPAPDAPEYYRLAASPHSMALPGDDHERAAVRRVLHHFLRHLVGVEEQLSPDTYRSPDLCHGLDVPGFVDVPAAVAWFTSERESALAAQRHAADLGEHDVVRKFGEAMWTVLTLNGRREDIRDVLTVQTLAAEAAERSDHVAASAAHARRSWALLRSGHPDDAIAAGNLALDLAERHGHCWSRSTALSALGDAYDALGRYAEALEYYHAARDFDLERLVPEVGGSAFTLPWAEIAQRWTKIALTHLNRGHPTEAVAAARRAVAFTTVKWRGSNGKAMVRTVLGRALLAADQPAAAIPVLHGAATLLDVTVHAALSGEIEQLLAEANLAVNAPNQASRHFRAAMQEFERSGHPERVEALRDRLKLSTVASTTAEEY